MFALASSELRTPAEISVQVKEKEKTPALKLKNSTLMNLCFLVKQYIPLGR